MGYMALVPPSGSKNAARMSLADRPIVLFVPMISRDHDDRRFVVVVEYGVDNFQHLAV